MRLSSLFYKLSNIATLFFVQLLEITIRHHIRLNPAIDIVGVYFHEVGNQLPRVIKRAH